MPPTPKLRFDDPRRLQNAALLRRSKDYAREQRGRSWWYLASTLSLFVGLVAVAAAPLPLLARIPASVLAGLVLVRLFILYHDYQHGTILKGSRLAAVVMWAYGLLALNPPSIWRRSHNHHHKNNAKIFGAGVGSYPVMTVAAYRRATPGQRRAYALTRHPLTIAAGYLTVFLYGMCIRSLLASPRAHFDSALAILVHVAVATALAIYDPLALVLAMIVPCAIAAATGAYLFYAQHNYPGVKLRDRASWDYVAAALDSSSFIRMSRLMHWFTGNIGYHHVHHLNARIPFYRLPEAMAGLPELQAPGTTTLAPREVARCLRLKLWDSALDRMVSFAEAMAASGPRRPPAGPGVSRQTTPIATEAAMSSNFGSP